MVFSNRDILRRLSTVVDPLFNEKISEVDGERKISFGLSEAGIDIRLGRELVLLPNSYQESILSPDTVLDPKDPHLDQLGEQVKVTGDYYDIPPMTYFLGASMEYFRIPTNVIGMVLGKSSYARSGLFVNFTPLEPGWEGFLTIECFNPLPLYLRVYVEEGIAQVLFFELTSPTLFGYEGNYQHQTDSPQESKV